MHDGDDSERGRRLLRRHSQLQSATDRRPRADHREGSFLDGNGNGAFDNAETFFDLAEPFRDDNENSTFESANGEDFFDFNNNQTRDPADGLFNGVLCNDTTGRCGAPATQSTGIGEQATVIFSGSTPTVTQPDGSNFVSPLNMGTQSAMALSFWVRDVNGNVMPGGTDIELTASGAGLQVAQPNSFSVPCSAIASGVPFSGITVYSFTVTSGTQTGSGIVTLTVSTDRRETIFQLGVNVM